MVRPAIADPELGYHRLPHAHPDARRNGYPYSGHHDYRNAPAGGDYDYDNDGLIEIRSIAQLDAICYDLDGDGVADRNAKANDYAAAFPNAAAGMGCPAAGCTGYELANNLDYGTQVTAQGWQPIGYWNSEDDHAIFTATFDGGGYTISNLFISRANYDNNVGLFGRSGAESIIRRVGLPSVIIVGNSNTGGLVGGNRGTISDSYVTGVVKGNNTYVGGLAGWNTGTITNSYTTGTVTGKGNNVGGLTGWSNKAIAHSHSDASVTGSRDRVGGLVGQNTDTGTITASYATGNVSGVAIPAA